MSNKPAIPMNTSPEAACFEAFLRSRKLKLTGERMAILQAVFHEKGHFDAEHLHDCLRMKDVSRATVYRTLDLLVQSGLVRKNSLGANHANFEAARGEDHHDHLICLHCGKVVEFYRADLEEIQDQLCREHDFRPVHHNLQIFGICPDCKGKTDEMSIRNLVAQLHV